jgi:hypothetical protein
MSLASSGLFFYLLGNLSISPGNATLDFYQYDQVVSEAVG